MGWPVAGFHSHTLPPVPSAPALASILPSGLNATSVTPPWVTVWRGEPKGWPVAGFHSRTVPFAGAGQHLAVGAKRHPGHAALGDRLERGADGLAGDRVRRPHCAVAVGARQHLAARAERQRMDSGLG